MTPGALQRKLFATAAQLGLDRQDRHALAEVILRRDVETWAGLSDSEMSRMMDAMEGYAYVRFLHDERARAYRAAALAMTPITHAVCLGV